MVIEGVREVLLNTPSFANTSFSARLSLSNQKCQLGTYGCGGEARWHGVKAREDGTRKSDRK